MAAAPAFEPSTGHVRPNRSIRAKTCPQTYLQRRESLSLLIILPSSGLGHLARRRSGGNRARARSHLRTLTRRREQKAQRIWSCSQHVSREHRTARRCGDDVSQNEHEDGLLSEFMAKRSRTDAPWVATIIKAGMAIVFLLPGDPIWLIAVEPHLSHPGLACRMVAVLAPCRDSPGMDHGPYRRARGMITLGLLRGRCQPDAWTISPPCDARVDCG